MATTEELATPDHQARTLTGCITTWKGDVRPQNHPTQALHLRRW